MDTESAPDPEIVLDSHPPSSVVDVTNTSRPDADESESLAKPGSWRKFRKCKCLNEAASYLLLICMFFGLMINRVKTNVMTVHGEGVVKFGETEWEVAHKLSNWVRL